MTVTTLPAESSGGLAANSASVRRSFRRFWPYVRADRRFLWLTFLILLVSAAAETVAIYMYALITDDALVKGSLSGFWLPAGVWAGLALVSGLSSFAVGWLTTWVSERFLLRVRDAVYAHLQQLSPDYLAGHDTGDLVARLTSDLDAIEALTASGVVALAGSLITIVFYAGACLWMSWQLSVAAFLLAPLIWLFARVFAKRIKSASRDERDSNGAISAAVSENLTNLMLVQAYNQQHTERDRLHGRGREWLLARVREAKLAGALTPVVDMAEILCLLLVIGFGIYQVAKHGMSLGDVLAFTVYLGYLYPPLRSLGDLAVVANSAAASSDRIAELMLAQPEVTEFPQARQLGRVRGEIRFDRVGYAYPDGDGPALHDVSFLARPGQLIMVTGASGAGKSTITKLLLRFADPAHGAVRLDGFDIRDLTLNSLRQQISLVPQHTQVFRGTVRDNLAYGRPGATDAEIAAAATAADAHEFLCRLPEGYQTELDGQGARLSGGQLQRLALARAILRDTPVLVLDEPTSGLDALATQRVLTPLRRLASNKTIIMISHDLSIAPFADLVLMLDRGRLVEQGTHADLLRRGGAYARLHHQYNARPVLPPPARYAPRPPFALPPAPPRALSPRPPRPQVNQPTRRWAAPGRVGEGSGRFPRIEPETTPWVAASVQPPPSGRGSGNRSGDGAERGSGNGSGRGSGPSGRESGPSGRDSGLSGRDSGASGRDSGASVRGSGPSGRDSGASGGGVVRSLSGGAGPDPGQAGPTPQAPQAPQPQLTDAQRPSAATSGPGAGRSPGAGAARS